jgi:hypothetical protein
LDGVTSRYTVGTEFRVFQGFWVELAFGAEKIPAGNTSMISLANLKYAFKSSPRFTQIPGSGDQGP